ncbi:hypothetical protein PG994_012900 [Apiospora phragmitis]|uniref:Uncharacterized protein n=1 Tax=Apiospora phragmitis TaxID=2905665 RepID=A0ABR1T743_9PEZI
MLEKGRNATTVFFLQKLRVSRRTENSNGLEDAPGARGPGRYPRSHQRRCVPIWEPTENVGPKYDRPRGPGPSH